MKNVKKRGKNKKRKKRLFTSMVIMCRKYKLAWLN